MSLPLPWVKKIFQKLTLTYGREFTDRWVGIPIEEVQDDWAHELRGFAQNPDAIKHGLEHSIGGKPPTVQDFKAACARHVAVPIVMIEAPADPARVAAELKKLEQVRRPSYEYDFKGWAKTILRDNENGVRTTPTVMSMARRALGLET